jgi:hypothetical protein
MQDKVDHSPGDGVDSAVVPRAGLAKPNGRKADATTWDCWAEREFVSQKAELVVIVRRGTAGMAGDEPVTGA